MKRKAELDTYTAAYVIALLVIDFATLFTLEVERIWLFMVPFIIIPAAKNLKAYMELKRSVNIFYWVTGLLCLQILIFEIKLYTYW